MAEAIHATFVMRPFAGATRKFELRLGEIKELEVVCGAGIGEIYTRVLGLRFKIDDLRQTIRLGLVGGGLDASQAMALVEHGADMRQVMPMHRLAQDVLVALFLGVDEAGNFVGLETPEQAGERAAPATSAPSTNAAPPPVSDRERSIQ